QRTEGRRAALLPCGSGGNIGPLSPRARIFGAETSIFCHLRCARAAPPLSQFSVGGAAERRWTGSEAGRRTRRLLRYFPLEHWRTRWLPKGSRSGFTRVTRRSWSSPASPWRRRRALISG